MKTFSIYYEEKQKGWLGVDFDSTLAQYTTWKGYEHLGEPIPEMVEKVKKELSNGRNVKIFTARIDNGEKAVKLIKDWCKKYLGQELEVTNIKDRYCEEIWDDKAKQVSKNKGEFV
jgi:hypothetical protein